MIDTNFRYEQYQTSGNRAKGSSYKSGYENNFDKDVYPLRGIPTNELKIRLQMNLNDFVNSMEKSNGFQVSVHPEL